MAEIANFDRSYIFKYTVQLDKPKPTDLFSLSDESKKNLLHSTHEAYKFYEEGKYPGEGYKVTFVGSNSGKNTLKASLEVHNSRLVKSAMDMPTDVCVICPKVEKNEQLEGFEQPADSLTRVIKTNNNNPMVVSTAKTGNWFELTLDEQMAMLATAEKVVKKFGTAHYNYELHIPVGIEAQQKVNHVCLHVLTGLNVALDYGNSPSSEVRKAIATYTNTARNIVSRYAHSAFDFAKAALVNIVNTIKYIALSLFSSFAIVTERGREYFKTNCVNLYGSVKQVAVSTIGIICPPLAVMAYGRA